MVLELFTTKSKKGIWLGKCIIPIDNQYLKGKFSVNINITPINLNIYNCIINSIELFNNDFSNIEDVLGFFTIKKTEYTYEYEDEDGNIVIEPYCIEEKIYENVDTSIYVNEINNIITTIKQTFP